MTPPDTKDIESQGIEPTCTVDQECEVEYKLSIVRRAFFERLRAHLPDEAFIDPTAEDLRWAGYTMAKSHKNILAGEDAMCIWRAPIPVMDALKAGSFRDFSSACIVSDVGPTKRRKLKSGL